MKTVTETIQEIHAYGTKVADDSLKVIEPIVGIPVAQGDINLWLLPKLPDGAVESLSDPQLAPGTTRGSRHCIRQSDLAHVRFYRLSNPNLLQGPILIFKKETVIEHPEHGDQLWPAGIVAVTYQRRYAEEIRRSQD
jgi:hypothetical protein